MSLDNVLIAAESAVQADPRPVRTPDPVGAPEVRPLPAPVEPAPPPDDVRVSEGYLERLLSQRADEVLDRFRGHPGRRRLVGEHPARRNGHRVAARVLDRIERRLAAAGDGQPQAEDAQAGQRLGRSLRKSFRRAFALLHKLGVARDERGARLLNDVRRALGDGIGRLEQPANAEATAEVKVQREVDLSLTREFQLQVTTQEGDVVTLRIDSQALRSTRLSLSAGPDGASIERQQQTSLEQQLSFRVEGELNADERAAIEELVSRAGELSNAFYRGDLGSALDGAGALGAVADPIAGLTLELGQTYERRVATAYGEVAALSSDAPAGDRSGAPSTPAEFHRARRRLHELPSLQALFGDTQALVNDLLAGALAAHPAAEDQAPQADG